MTSRSPLIHVVDDDASLRGAVGRLLQTVGYTVALYESGEELLQAPLGKEAGCILLDLKMAALDGAQLRGRLAERGCTLPVVFLAGHGEIPERPTANTADGAAAHGAAGAEDFLSKQAPKTTLLATIERALAQHRETRAQQDRLENLRRLASTLTPREARVFALIIHGKLNKQIGCELGIAQRAVRAHRHAAMAKLKVRSLAEAAAISGHLGVPVS
jgi:FixJ family two-component response regulator